MQLTGDSAHQYSVDDPSAQQPAETEGAESSKTAVTEVQRLRYMIDSINAAAAVLPKVSAGRAWPVVMRLPRYVACVLASDRLQWTCSWHGMRHSCAAEVLHPAQWQHMASVHD
jgi:hypothetical protein